MNITIERGRALVLVGPQGSGKTLLARKIAEAYGGSYIQIDGHELVLPHTFSALLRGHWTTVIVEEINPRMLCSDLLKTAISSKKMPVLGRCAGDDPVTVRPPNFIFCTGDVDWLPADQKERRFRIVHMGEVTA